MEPDVIPLPSLRRLWRVKLVDSFENPKVSAVVLVRGAQSVMDAHSKAKQFNGWKNFIKKYPNADVVAVEFAGWLEN